MNKTHHNLEVWKSSLLLVSLIYDASKSFPTEEKFVLAPQMRRAAISIPSNIAEGCSRESIKESIHFLNIALSSATELETQIEICKILGYKINEPLESTLKSTRFQLLGFLKYLKRKK